MVSSIPNLKKVAERYGTHIIHAWHAHASSAGTTCRWPGLPRTCALVHVRLLCFNQSALPLPKPSLHSFYFTPY